MLKNMSISFAAALAIAGCSETVDVKFDESVADYTPVVREILESHPDGNVTLRFSRGC